MRIKVPLECLIALSPPPFGLLLGWLVVFLEVIEFGADSAHDRKHEREAPKDESHHAQRSGLHPSLEKFDAQLQLSFE